MIKDLVFTTFHKIYGTRLDNILDDKLIENLKEFVVYVIRLKGTDRIYCGQTDKFIQRMNQHKGASTYKTGKLYNAIRKYGIESFEYAVINSFDTREEADNFEIAFIKEHDLTSEKHFNISKGGVFGGFHLTKEELREAFKGTYSEFKPCKVYRKDGSFVGTFDSQNSACKALGFKGTSGLFKSKSLHGYCFFRIDEEIPDDYFREENFGGKAISIAHSQSIVGINIETLEKVSFYGMSEAGRQLGVSKSAISHCCLGKTKSIKDYVFVKSEDEHLLEQRLYEGDKGIIGTHKKTGQVVEFKTTAEAGRNLGTDKTQGNISQCLRGKTKTACGYYWQWRRDVRKNNNII